MVKCDLCGMDLKWYQTKVTCDFADCSVTVCKPCFSKQNELNSPNSWGRCDNCGEQFCGKHFESHPCDEEADDVDSDESSDVSEISEFESKNQLFVIICYTDRSDNSEPYLEDLNELISEYLAKGFVIQGYYSEACEVWMVKKNG
jgi:hypothetical protein